jgi:hypothetical protein
VFSVNPTDGPPASADQRGFVLNLRVADLPATLEDLRRNGVDVEARTIEWEGGKHGWVGDLDGNRIELYEGSRSRQTRRTAPTNRVTLPTNPWGKVGAGKPVLPAFTSG